MSSWHGGKGSSRRKEDKKKIDANWDLIFKKKERIMNCWYCGTGLIWGGDHDIGDENEEYDMVTNLSCPDCKAYVEIYMPKGEANE